MRVLLACWAVVAATRAAPDLESLYQAHEWFALRDAIDGRAPAKYRGMVACAFNDSSDCDRLLDSIVTAAPRSEPAQNARDMLASVGIRTGRYARALGVTEDALAVQPARPDLVNQRSFLATLRGVPDLTAIQGRPARVANRSGRPLHVPATVNGRAVDWIADTGANLSSISESEAARVGLTLRSSNATATNIAGQSIGFRVAVAEEIVIGDTTIRHVAFAVFPDSQQPFAEQPPGQRGLFGIPVLAALGRFAWTRDTFEIGGALSSRVAAPNLCFDGATAVTTVRFNGQTLAFNLDTGASRTDLWAPFAASFATLVQREGHATTVPLAGVGGTGAFEAVTLPSVTLTVDATDVHLRPARVMLTKTSTAAGGRYGNLGIDLLNQAPRVSIDFVGMRLSTAIDR